MNALDYRDSSGMIQPMRTNDNTKETNMNAKPVLAGVAAVVAGLAAAFAMTVAPTASAHTVDDLTAAGASVTIINLPGSDDCHDYRVTYHGNRADLGSDCDAAFQGNLDSYYAAYIAPPAPPTTSTTDTTTTDVTTTTDTTPQQVSGHANSKFRVHRTQ